MTKRIASRHLHPLFTAPPWSQEVITGAALGYDFDTLASDLNTLLTTLNLTDVSLVGFSMGTGEVTRYIGKCGTKSVRKAALIGTIGPYLVKAADNPEGVDPSVFDGIKTVIKKIARLPCLGVSFTTRIIMMSSAAS